jgi:hypothetical protein
MRYRNPAVLSEVTFQRNNLSWTQGGKRSSIHKLIPEAPVLFYFLKGEFLGLLPLYHGFSGPVIRGCIKKFPDWTYRLECIYLI